MSDNGRLIYRIGMVGPSRVGKTSLITALLRGGQRLLEGSGIGMKAVGSPTQKRLTQHREDLDGSLLAGTFQPDALGGNQEKFEFQLLLDPGVPDAGIELRLLDYPGEWFDPRNRPPDSTVAWAECERFLEQSSVLIVPIDAAVLMEATNASHLRAMPAILATTQVDDVVRSWLTERKRRPDEPGLLLLCPVKCESYFTDNGGDRDDSANLLGWVRRVYRDVIDAVPAEAPHVRTVYCPVDTIGCVEILRADWFAEPTRSGKLTFLAEYGVRPPGRQSIKGADDVLMALCRHLVGARTRVEEQAAVTKYELAHDARLYAERDEGFFWNIWFQLTGERRLREEIATSRRDEAVEALSRVQALNSVVEELARRNPGERVRLW
ncbi:MAG: hypothetical protein ACR2GH_04455 [Pseudonocardia sp.]